jgi:hypothetical protein
MGVCWGRDAMFRPGCREERATHAALDGLLLAARAQGGRAVDLHLLACGRHSEVWELRGDWRSVVSQAFAIGRVVQLGASSSDRPFPLDPAVTAVAAKLQPGACERDALIEEACHVAAYACLPHAVPRPLGGATLPCGLRITFMGLVEDAEPLAVLVKCGSRRAGPATGVALERSLRALWAGGVLHGDVHGANVLVTRLGEPFLVDFGMSVRMGRRRRAQLRRGLAEAGGGAEAAAAAFQVACGDYLRRVTSRRGYDVGLSHPDGSALIAMVRRCSMHTVFPGA